MSFLPPAGFLAGLIAVSAMAALPLGEWPAAPWSFLGLVPLVFGLALAFGAWVQARFIAREERQIEARFGDAYRAYRRRVRRWI